MPPPTLKQTLGMKNSLSSLSHKRMTLTNSFHSMHRKLSNVFQCFCQIKPGKEFSKEITGCQWSCMKKYQHFHSTTFKVLKGMRIRLCKFKLLLFLQFLEKITQSGTRKSTEVSLLNKALLCGKWAWILQAHPKGNRSQWASARNSSTLLLPPYLGRCLCLKWKQGANSNDDLLSAQKNRRLMQQLKSSSQCFTAQRHRMGGSWAPTTDPATRKHSSTWSAHLSKSRRIFQGKSSGMAFPRNKFASQTLPPSSTHAKFIYLTCPLQTELYSTKKTYRETTVPLSLSPSNRMRKQMEKLSVMMWWVYPYADNANTNNSSCRYYPVNNTFGQFFFKGMKVILILCRVISSHPSMVNFPSQHNAYELDRLLMFIFMGRKKNILALNFPLLLMIKKLIKY